MTLFGNKVFTEVIIKRRSLQWALVKYDIFIKSRNVDTQTGRHRGKTTWRHTERMWYRELGWCIHKPVNVKDGQKPIRRQEQASGDSPQCFRGEGPCSHLFILSSLQAFSVCEILEVHWNKWDQAVPRKVGPLDILANSFPLQGEGRNWGHSLICFVLEGLQ